MAFPQADIKTDVFMEVPQHFDVNGQNGLQRNESAKHPRQQKHVLKLKKNVTAWRMDHLRDMNSY